MIPPEPGSTAYRLLSDPARLRPHPALHSLSSASMADRNSAARSESTASERDSHDLSLSPSGRGRESLLDNLLLSFDKIGDGSLGPFDHSPYFSNIDEVDDDADSASNYSRDQQADYHAHAHTHAPADGGGGGGAYRSRGPGADHGVGAGAGDSYGVAYDAGGRDTRSRGRALSSSHGYPYEFYDAAPAPSIRSGPRNRSPSPPRSPRLVRRPSNKSLKSLRSRDQHLQFDDPITLPPLPAFANPPPPAPSTAMGSSTKSSGSKPGFFRRVFGGGSSSSSSANAKPPPAAPAAPAPAAAPAQPAPTETPQSVITKKASFFRRRKKSVSDAVNAPPLPGPVKVDLEQPVGPPPTIGSTPAMSSPTVSLRAAMNPYLNNPTRTPHFEASSDGREPLYLDRNATIRTVASSDNVSPRRPSFFAESPRQRDVASYTGDGTGESGRKYKKEIYVRGDAQSTPKEGVASSDHNNRPQTSPHSPTQRSFYRADDDERPKDMYWPPSPNPRRGILSKSRTDDPTAQDSDRKSSVTTNVSDRPRQGSQPIISIKDVEEAHAEEVRRREATKETGKETGKGKHLSLDTVNLDDPAKRISTSWLGTPTPASLDAMSAETPTVTLQGDGPEAKAEPLEHGDDLQNNLVVGEPKPANFEEPSEADRQMAQKIFEGDEEFMAKEKAAAWLGDTAPAREMARKAYMELFDFHSMNILAAMRLLCERLLLKGETQQVDRIMVAFAKRWCECNSNHGFKSVDVVHTILYSLLLLNTDLHMVDVPSSQKMTRGQFIKNTMSTVRRGLLLETSQDGSQTDTVQSAIVPRSQTPFRQDSTDDSPMPTVSQSATFPRDKKGTESGAMAELARPEPRSNRLSRLGNMSPRLPLDGSAKTDFDVDGTTALVNEPLAGGTRVWETQVEIVLKDFYTSVRGQALPLHGSPQEQFEPSSSSTLSVMLSSGMLRRSPSNVSRAASEMSAARRNDSNRLGGNKWTSKNRSHQRLYNGSFAGSSRTSLEERSLWSPSASSTWSKYSLDKTQTSMSVDSFGSAFTHGDYQQSIGFASALSHAIIREENASAHSGAEDGDMNANMLDADEELELAGAPWAKEGMVKHKHHLESVEKRAKSRSWTECFAVIERGYVRLFLFPSKNPGKNSQQANGGIVGGGNWMENAEPIGTFQLRQTIASALPPPGYSKARPNVWALSLPTGAVHLFEVGTSEIVREFVSTANYWSARLSKEPLVGGVSNIEYGWSDSIVDPSDPSRSPPESSHGAEPRTSLQMSIRSSIDHGTVRPRLPGDKVHIRDWMPPAQSMVASSLEEAEQLRALENYVANIEAELQRHQELRPAMALAFSPRHPNSTKALNNWEKKSSYLLREIVKFRTYIDTLHVAIDKRKALKASRVSDVDPAVAAAANEELAPAAP